MADKLFKACEHLLDRRATEEELIKFCRADLPSFKRPRNIILVDSYPVAPAGKIQRGELRQMAAVVLAGPQSAAGASA